jgi:hypothetical protein
VQTGEVDIEELHELLRGTVHTLRDARLPDEALATLKQPRFRPPRFIPAGRAWRLGVLLIDNRGQLFRTGEVTRAVEPLRGVANKGVDAEGRREMRRAATRGKFTEGEVVNFGYSIIDVIGDSDPVRLRDGEAQVRWNTAGSWRSLDGYLKERITLAQR